jgi:hypothetical protein
MNLGAILMKPNLLSEQELAEAAQLARASTGEKHSVHKEGRYAGVRWFQVDLEQDLPLSRKVLGELGVKDPELLVFYYLEPGATIHPHRDLTGAGLNNRIRFHVPIITNDQVKFMVSGKRVVMKPGDLWCLDTSYLHSVENAGTEPRVHMVIECDITPELRARLPHGIRPMLHNVAFAGIMGAKLSHALVWNSIKDPAYFRAQMGMLKRFIGWRFLKTRRAD